MPYAHETDTNGIQVGDTIQDQSLYRGVCGSKIDWTYTVEAIRQTQHGHLREQFMVAEVTCPDHYGRGPMKHYIACRQAQIKRTSEGAPS